MFISFNKERSCDQISRCLLPYSVAVEQKWHLIHHLTCGKEANRRISYDLHFISFLETFNAFPAPANFSVFGRAGMN